MTTNEKAEHLKLKFNSLAVDVVDEILDVIISNAIECDNINLLNYWEKVKAKLKP